MYIYLQNNCRGGVFDENRKRAGTEPSGVELCNSHREEEGEERETEDVFQS